MYFETEAYFDEYVIDGGNSGLFAGDDTRITYTPDDPERGSPVSIATDEISTITFKRDATLQRNNLLGWFFAVMTVVLFFATYLYAFIGQPTDPTVDFVSVLLSILSLTGITTTYEYFSGEEYDVIVAYIRTDTDESHVFAERLKNTEFVNACDQLIESDIETQNRNKKLRAALSD